jgi:predicted component of type VI protein secretion system
MHALKLYHRSKPDQPIEARTLACGDLAIGRDPKAGWVLPDATTQVSRLHCILTATEGHLTLQDLSRNGVFVNDEHTRAPYRDPLPLGPAAKLFVGPYLIAVEAVADASQPLMQIGEPPSLFRSPLLSSDELSIPDDWTAICEPQQPVKVEAASKLISKETKQPSCAFIAFCAGAKIDPREFADEDEVDVMRRAGAVYQATVLGLSALMNERQTAKQDFGIDKTKIGLCENNPFKVTATSRLGVDVLRRSKRGFITGPEALKAAFVDIKKHLVSMLAGSRAALASALDTLNPERINEDLRGPSFLMGGKAGSAWKEYQRVYSAFRMDVLTNPRNSTDAAFRKAYARQMLELEEAGKP